jgi:hypothetical protein
VTINDNDATLGPNQIDQASYFVRQHYVDFLNFDGHNFSLNNLNQFNGKFVNAEMVKAFIPRANTGKGSKVFQAEARA